MSSIEWDILPVEIQTHIIWLLSLPEILRLRLVSKNFRSCCDNDGKWREEVQMISAIYKLPSAGTWKALYINCYDTFAWSSENKGPHIQLNHSQKEATSLKDGGWSKR